MCEHDAKKCAMHGTCSPVLKKRRASKRKKLPKYVPFRNIYEESDASRLTSRQQLMVIKYREALSKADTHIFFVPDDSVNLVYSSKGTWKRSKMSKSQGMSANSEMETRSFGKVEDTQCLDAVSIHVGATTNTSGLNAENLASSNSICEPKSNENAHNSAKAHVEATTKYMNGALSTKSVDACLARSSMQGILCSGRLSRVEEIIFKALRYHK